VKVRNSCFNLVITVVIRYNTRSVRRIRRSENYLAKLARISLCETTASLLWRDL